MIVQGPLHPSMKIKQGADNKHGSLFGRATWDMNTAEVLGWHREGRNVSADQNGVERA